jgi:hypothetical protein
MAGVLAQERWWAAAWLAVLLLAGWGAWGTRHDPASARALWAAADGDPRRSVAIDAARVDVTARPWEAGWAEAQQRLAAVAAR